MISSRLVLVVASAAILGVYLAMIGLKGISTDEGLRMAIINGGAPYTPAGIPDRATWSHVLETNAPVAYQPGYFLLLNTLMRVAGTQHVFFFRAINIAFLGLCLAGLLQLSRGWRLLPRLFLLVLFALNAFLLMHVLQIREYIVGVAFYIWSTWLVLRLERHEFGRPWVDTGWFAGYGALLLAGFFVQSWVAFPAVGQALFLAIHRRRDRLRFYAHLALSYLVVLACAWPYLLAHRQKVNVGRWATESESVAWHLSQGFHLVFSGHVAGQGWFPELLFWCGLAGLALATAVLLFPGRNPDASVREDRRQALLVSACSVVALAFQVAYALKVENLSLWPRYFIIHYFFLVWLLALGFRRLTERAGNRLAVGAVLLLVAASAAFQTWSYRRDPWLDTSQNAEENWQAVATGLAQILHPDDAVLVQDMIVRSTLTFTRPLSNPVYTWDEPPEPGSRFSRLIYIEQKGAESRREEVTARLAAAGLVPAGIHGVPGPGGLVPMTGWRFILYRRP